MVGFKRFSGLRKAREMIDNLYNSHEVGDQPCSRVGHNAEKP